MLRRCWGAFSPRRALCKALSCFLEPLELCDSKGLAQALKEQLVSREVRGAGLELTRLARRPPPSFSLSLQLFWKGIGVTGVCRDLMTWL